MTNDYICSQANNQRQLTNMLKKIRQILAIVMWIGITLLFLDFTGTAHEYLSWMAKVQFLPAVLALNVAVIVGLIVLTLIMGRIYCSVICPLGVMQDVFAWIGKLKIFRKNKKAKHASQYSYSKPKTWLRLAVLVVFIALMILGFNSIAILLAPYSAYGRIAANMLQPVYLMVNNLLASAAEHYDSYTFYTADVWLKSISSLIVSAVTFVVIGILAWRNGRTWCNTICPVGTVLGYLSRLSWLKIRVEEDKCIKCGICAKNCKAACIDIQKGVPAVIDYSRCVVCGNCEGVCSKQAIHLAPAKKSSSASAPQAKGSTPDGDKPADMSRRTFVSLLTATAATAALEAQDKTVDGGLAVIEDKQIPNRHTPLTPPGSLSARNLAQHCTGCQLCIAACPNGVLRPSTSLANMLQPEMQYDRGYCRPECTRCSDACPAGAIRPIEAADKSAIQIGHAVWIKKNCIPLTDHQPCGNCERHCPTGAIQMIQVDNTITQGEDGRWRNAEGEEVDGRTILRIPAINTEKCIGCGACENLCPARPFSAIYVEGHEVHREI